MTRLSLVLLMGSVGCVGATRTVQIAAPAAPTTVHVAVNIAVGQPLVERDARLALAAHGRWQSSSLGELWIPAVAEREEFVPYVTHGQWVQSAQGPQWSSQFAWGPIVFHYGRWVRVGSLWGWRFDRAYSPSTVLWRRSGSYVGWSVAGHDEWCWLLFDELYAPSPWRSIERGRAAAPIAATSRDIAHPELELGVGWGPQGVPHMSGDTTRGQQRLERAPTDNRWATVVIRDERAEQEFEQLWEYEQYEQSVPSTHSPVTALQPTSPVANARTAQSFTRVTPSTSGTLWGDEERLRAPVVANIDPRFTPHATLRASVANVQRAAPLQETSEPRMAGASPSPSSTVVAQGAVVVPGSVSTGVSTTVARTPAALATPVTVVLPPASTISSTRVR
jgi:hypothetical protein